MHSKYELKMLQALPLEIKVMKTQARIREWVQHYGIEDVYVSFSGGKDSTVLLDIARKIYPNIKAVFVDTGLEYPEIREFVKTVDNVEWLRPKMNFYQVILKYGYPMISKEVSESVAQARMCLKQIAEGKDKSTLKYAYRLPKMGINIDGVEAKEHKKEFNCEKYKPLCYVDFDISNQYCSIMKKRVVHKHEGYSITAQTAEESRLRTQQWLKNGCNGFDMKRPVSNPMSFWTEQDVLKYIKDNNLRIASVYGEVIDESPYTQMSLWGEEFSCDKCSLKTTGVDRTGCVFCGYGAHLEKEPTRFQRLKQTHPKLYEYCMEGGEYTESGKWVPNKKGLGMRHIFEELNEIYGNDFIKYK